MAPLEYPTVYNSWYECSRDAHVESVKLLSKLGYKNVNDYKVGTKYHCKAVQTYCHCGRTVVAHSQYQPATCTLESFNTQP